MQPIELQITTYNQLPATQRRTVSGVRHALVNGHWRPVKFVRPAPVYRATYLAAGTGR